jgi:hypothetical protein
VLLVWEYLGEVGIALVVVNALETGAFGRRSIRAHSEIRKQLKKGERR